MDLENFVSLHSRNIGHGSIRPWSGWGITSESPGISSGNRERDL